MEGISDNDWDTLLRRGFVAEADGREKNAREILDRHVTEEQAARFFGWQTDDEAFDIKRVQREIRSGTLPHSRRLAFWTRLTVGDLLHYDPTRSSVPRRPLWSMVADHPIIGILGLILAILALVVAVFTEEIRWIVAPPQTTLTFILDGSHAMGEPIDGSITGWDVQRHITRQKMPGPEFSDKERVAIWVQRSIPQASGDCQDDFELRTKGYESADQINLNTLLQEPEFRGSTSPGAALLAAAMRMPRFSLRPITHRAIVLSNSQTTCRGLRPIDDVCAHVADIAYYWSTWSNAKLVHEIVVIDFGAQQVGATYDTCGNVPSIEVISVDLDPAEPKESNTELCRIDAKLCNAPPPFPSPAPQVPPTSTPVGGQGGSNRPANTSTPTPSRNTPGPRPPSPPTRASPLTPTPAAVMRLRSLPGRRAAITEGCNQGRVIGEIGELDSVRLSLEAEVVSVPEDYQFLAQYGCIRVFSGILGDPSHGYAGYVQANDVCASPKNFDYWMAQPSMTTLPGRELLRRCPD